MNKKQIQLKKKAKEAKEKAKKNTKISKETKKKMAKDQAAFQCSVCRQVFPQTTKQPALQGHIDNKHSKLKKTFSECFPTAGSGESKQ
jgi:hypothetical protein